MKKTNDQGYNIAIIGVLVLLVGTLSSSIVRLMVGYQEGNKSIFEPIISTVILGGGIIGFQIIKAKSKTPSIASDILSLIFIVVMVSQWLNHYTGVSYKETQQALAILNEPGIWIGFPIAIGLFSIIIIYLVILRNKYK